MRTQKRPKRPQRKIEWAADIITYGRKCTPASAWQAKNLAGLYDAIAVPLASSTMEASYKRVAKALRSDEWGRYYRSRLITIPHLKDE